MGFYRLALFISRRRRCYWWVCPVFALHTLQSFKAELVEYSTCWFFASFLERLAYLWTFFLLVHVLSYFLKDAYVRRFWA